MGTRRKRRRQQHLGHRRRSADDGRSHPFYRRVESACCDEQGFDDFVEAQCASVLCRHDGAAEAAAGHLLPAAVDRLLRGHRLGARHRVARGGLVRDCADFLGLASGRSAARPLDDFAHAAADRSGNASRRLHVGAAAARGRRACSRARRSAIDATTLEANAAMRSIVRRDTGESYQEFLTRLAKASGIETPTREDLARTRSETAKKKTSNDDWTNPHDPDASVTKMKDGRTHLAHKAEHAVDLDTGAIVAVTVQGADRGDTDDDRRDGDCGGRADRRRRRCRRRGATMTVEEIVATRGITAIRAVIDLDGVGLRTYISEPERGRRRWHGQAPRRRRRCTAIGAGFAGAAGSGLLRRRGERSGAHVRAPLRDRRDAAHASARASNILKRLLIHAGGFNLGLVMRHAIGVGTPRGLQGRAAAVIATVFTLLDAVRQWSVGILRSTRLFAATREPVTSQTMFSARSLATATYATGC